ncbi:MAG TPA: hypothetical protein VF062_17250 [Candidatus Limnocylindrales bacterium]
MRTGFLLVALVLSACSGTPSVVESQSPQARQAKLIEISVKGRTVTPPPGRIEITRGEKVRLVVHDDTADEIHVHGYDLEAPVGSGRDGVIEFNADQTGLFEVETHTSGLLLTQLAVR